MKAVHARRLDQKGAEMTAATKPDVTAQIGRVWDELDALFTGLDERHLDRQLFSGDVPGWRVRDLMPHFAFWLRLSARGARQAAQSGDAPDQGTTLRAFLGIDTHFDELNARTFASWRERPAAEQLAELRAGRDDLLSALMLLPAELILIDDDTTGGIRRYIWQPAINHPREHREHIDAALAKEGASR